MCKAWLRLQPAEHFGKNFRPQPFEQLIKVLHDMGHEPEARQISKFKEYHHYRAHLLRQWLSWRDSLEFFGHGPVALVLNGMFWPLAVVLRFLATVIFCILWGMVAWCTAYGYGYARLGLFLLLFWLAGWHFYRLAAAQGAFAPANPVVYLNEMRAKICGQNWTSCKDLPPEITVFNPALYSLDVMAKVLDLGQKRDWQPVNVSVHYKLPYLEDRPWWVNVNTFARVQTLSSWFVLGLLALMSSGLIKKP
jgi:hypothetical protein